MRNKRRKTLFPRPRRRKGLLVAMNGPLKTRFRPRFGFEAATLPPVRAEGSNRRIYRLAGRGATAVGVLNDDAKENRAFIEFSKHFRREGVPVPEFYGE